MKSDVTQPSMVTHIRNSCSAFNSSKCTHTHHEHTPGAVGIYAVAPGEQLGVRCLTQGHLSRGIEGGERCIHSPHPKYFHVYIHIIDIMNILNIYTHENICMCVFIYTQ